jgi:FixJ family two-component response regulator
LIATAKPLPVHPPRRIAVVDDSPAVRQSLRLLLGARGYVVDTFTGADDLLLNLKPEDFDCYVIDLKLDGMDGFALLELLRQRGIAAPAIMISGWELPALEATAQRAGFAALVRKPMMDTSLVRVLRDVLPE